ncbi:MAG: Gfo/Idh/MocA family oxidoreductase [Phycisphaerae bacterium]|nr:Gfo/Idh/MocA family oxidoreductase [Phycisphaerae bacterium]
MTTNNEEKKVNSKLDRRSFLRTSALAGVGLMTAPMIAGAQSSKKDEINIGFIGLGQQFERLFDDAIMKTQMYKTENIQFKAVCDIFPYRRNRWSKLMKAYKHDVNAYEDYKEMLEKEKGRMDAVIIATPDWMHAPMAIAAMEAGYHVYCEKEMSNDLAMAKKMVQTSQKTNKLLQIGHQRRSNPRYLAAEKLIKEYKLLGEIRNINAQWNRSVASHSVPLPKEKLWMSEADLQKHGYGSMQELYNWRWYKKFGGGPLGDLGSHQIDIFNWFLGEKTPDMVMASGGKDFYDYELDENVMSIYNYKTDAGSVRAFYQVLNNTSWGGYGNYYEVFMGEHGTLIISETTYPTNNGWFCMENYAKLNNVKEITDKWNKAIKDKLIGAAYDIPIDVKSKQVLVLGGTKMSKLVPHRIMTKYDKAVHAPHIKNFLDAIRGDAKLTCPGKIGYETAVSVLSANKSIETGDSVKFKHADFEV